LNNTLVKATDQITTTSRQTLEPLPSLCHKNHNSLAVTFASTVPSGPTTLFYGPSTHRRTCQTSTSALFATDNSPTKPPSDVTPTEPTDPHTTSSTKPPLYKWTESLTFQNMKPP
jgi:hypothetical protein